jgi:hypothetical protein
MTFTGAITFAINSVNELGEDKAGIMAAPDLEDKKGGFLPGMPLSQVITPYSKNKEASAALLTWLHGPKAQQLMYEQSNGAMMPIDDRFDFGQVDRPWLKRVYDQVLDAMKRDIPYADGIVPFDILGEGPMKATTAELLRGPPTGEGGRDVPARRGQLAQAQPPTCRPVQQVGGLTTPNPAGPRASRATPRRPRCVARADRCSVSTR